MSVRILVIEDNQTSLELMRYLLGAFGYNALCALSGEDGIRIAAEHVPDLILCDIQLPGMNGHEVLKHLKKESCLQRIPVIAVTAYAMVGDRDLLIESGFTGYLSKPINPETFIREVEEYLHADKRSNQIPHTYGTHESEPVDSSKRATILVVDDSPVNRDLIQSTLKPFGFDLILASSVSEAMSILRRTIPDLILSDLHMPNSTGYEFLKLVKMEPSLRSIPFLVITSSVTGEEERDLCMNLGAKRFIVRPIEPEKLLAEVKTCLV